MPEFAEILVNKQKIYTYAISPELQSEIAIGQEVEVTLRNTNTSGYVLKFVPKPKFETLPIISICSKNLYFNKQLVELAEYIADKYKCLFPTAMKAVLPK
ncbi:hypothetical protein OAR19_00385 [bacterium]|nr:hypothetical protein [bacterium]